MGGTPPVLLGTLQDDVLLHPLPAARRSKRELHLPYAHAAPYVIRTRLGHGSPHVLMGNLVFLRHRSRLFCPRRPAPICSALRGRWGAPGPHARRDHEPIKEGRDARLVGLETTDVT